VNSFKLVDINFCGVRKQNIFMDPCYCQYIYFI